MKKNILFILLLILFPINTYAANDISINCNKNQLKINEETTCNLKVNNLDFIIIDVTGKVKLGDNLSLINSSYDSTKWLSLDNNFSVLDINLMRHNNDKINSITIATFKIKANKEATGESKINFDNIAIGNSDYQSVPLNCSPIKIYFGNNINTLKSLKISGINLDFSSDKTKYSAETDNDKIVIEALATDPKAKISGSGTKKINYGSNNINIIVTAENGATKTYTININRKDNRSSDNNLKSLKINHGTINFKKDNTDYTVNVSNKVEKIEFIYELSDSKSKAELIGNTNLSVGENKFTIKVTAENEKVKEYNIIVIRNEKPAIISSNEVSNIIIKGYELKFIPSKKEYTIKTNDKKLDIEVILKDNNSTYNIEGNNNLTNGSAISIIAIDTEGNENVYTLTIENTNFNYIILIILLIVSLIINIILLIIIILNKKKNNIQNNSQNNIQNYIQEM